MAIAQEEGVILRNLGDALALCPPLIISPEEIDDLFDRVARTLDRVLDHARRKASSRLTRSDNGAVTPVTAPSSTRLHFCGRQG